VTGDPAAPLAAVWPEVEAALPPDWGQAPVEAAQWSPRVWKVTLAGGRALAVKLAADADGVGGEPATLRILHEHGAPVPALLAVPVSPPRRWFATEWSGDVTLEDVAQDADGADLDVLGRSLAEAVLAVEATLEAQAGARASAAETESARIALCHQIDAWWRAAPPALGWLIGVTLSRPLRSALEEVRALAISCVPRLGSLDYNPRNVVVGTRGPILLDFSACGFDWRERRVAQYGTATGAGRPAGTFVSVITPVAARHYARLAPAQIGDSEEDSLARLDAHEVALLLAAATQLHLVAQGQAEPERIAAWQDVPARRERLLALLRRRLAPDGPAERLRSLVR
jgi:hypothetical protein